MILSDITLKQFRSHSDVRFVFDEKITFITGQNGSGKTNLLEAIYMLLYGTSFRGGDGDVLQHGMPWWKINGTIDESVRELRYQPDHSPPKQLKIFIVFLKK